MCSLTLPSGSSLDRRSRSLDTIKWRKVNQINFSKNHVSGNARKIGVTFIWWFTKGSNGCKPFVPEAEDGCLKKE